jgi:hypothetical protein
MISPINDPGPLKTQEDAVRYFISRLDADMVDTLLDEKRTYQDMDKQVFIANLRHAFDEFLEAGDTVLLCTPGQCNSTECNYRYRGYSFEGNKSTKHMDLIIENDNEGRVRDIYECRHFLCDGNRKTNCMDTRVRIRRL